MDTFSRFALFTVARDASFAALAAGIIMVAYSFDPPVALVLGASIALFFAIVMLLRGLFLTEDRVVSCEPWTVMQPEERPVGDDGRAFACERLGTIMLSAARHASGVAAGMFGLGLIAAWI